MTDTLALHSRGPRKNKKREGESATTSVPTPLVKKPSHSLFDPAGCMLCDTNELALSGERDTRTYQKCNTDLTRTSLVERMIGHFMLRTFQQTQTEDECQTRNGGPPFLLLFLVAAAFLTHFRLRRCCC